VRLIFLIILCLFVASGALAQSLIGTVYDPQGGAVPAAVVEVRATGARELRTTTDSQGRFTIADPRPGQVLFITAIGFAEYQLELPSPVPATLNVILQPAPIGVNVTVTGDQTRQTDAAASIAVITIESLNVTAARTVDDTVRQIAGFQLFRRSSSRTTNPTAQGGNLRGMSGSGASRASVLFDGLSVNDAFGGWTYWSRVPLISIEQIEVLRGGSSSVYGSGALSGAVNMVPLRLDDEKLKLKFETSLGAQNTGDASGVLLASPGRWEADIVGDVFKTDGYVPVEEALRGAVDTRAASRHSNMILRLGRRFGDKDRVFIRGNLFGERRENGTSLTNNRTYFRQFAAGADLKGFNVRAFGEWQVYDQTFSSVSADRHSETLTRIQRVPSNAFGASATWRRQLTNHSVVAGGEILNVRGFSDEIGFFAGQPTNTSRAGGEARDVSLFVQDTWAATPRFSLNLSARVDHRRNSDGLASTRAIAAGTTVETSFAERSDNAFSPRVGIVYEVNSDVSVYGAYSRSFRAPSLNELYRGFRVGNIVTNANALLTPERADTIEAGTSAVYFDRKLIARASVYQALVRDPVVSVTVSTTPALITRQRQNVGSTVSRGLEVEVESSPVDGLKVNGSYLLVDATISNFPASPDIVGAKLPQVARHNFTAQAVYRYRSRWNVSTQLRAASSQYEDDRNTLRLRPYFIADARFSYRFPRFTEAFVSVENLFNTCYDIALTPVRSVAAPRSVRFGLRFDLSKL
jgi:outer membrane receptor protein involved in Fe transport